MGSGTRCYGASSAASKTAGFTLVELANVVAIVGLLAVIAIPRINSTAIAARRTKCQEAQRTIYESSMLYAADNLVGTGDINVNALVGDYVTQSAAECPESTTVGYDDYTIRFVGNEPRDVTCDVVGANHNWAP